MNPKDLARMANQIADFYRSYPREEAVAGVAAHIRDFWDPRMRAGLADCLGAGGTDMSEVAMAGALEALKAK